MNASAPIHLSRLDPDLDEARRFLQLLDPSTNEFTFQIFMDRKRHDGPTLALILHGTLDEHAAELIRRNRQGAGIFVTVNKTDGKGRKVNNIIEQRAVWHEDDVGFSGTFPLTPSVAVESSPGKYHRYWLIETLIEHLTAEEHRGVMEHMDAVYGSDPNAKDLSRVLRVPGFFHMKGEPFQVRIIEASGSRYTKDELLNAFPPFPVNAYSAKPDSLSAKQAHPPSEIGDPLRDAYALKALRDEAKRLAETPQGGGEHGGRNHALNVAAGKLGGFVPLRLSRGEVEASLFNACIENGLVGDGEASVWKTMESGLTHGMKTPRCEGMQTTPGQDFEDVSIPEDGDTKEINRLAALSTFDYDRERKETAKALGIRVTELDSAVTKKRRGLEPASETAKFLAPPDPWATPVDGQELIAEMVRIIRRHVVLPDMAAEGIALWVLHAHAHDAAAISPILAFESPEKRCGKTTATSLIAELVPKALPTSNITAASLFRIVDEFRPTVLIDEADTFLRDNEDLRGILNSGHNRRQAYATRLVGDNHEPKIFSTWAPKVIALIGELPDTLQDRSIAVRLRRKLPTETVERLRLDKVGGFTDLQSKASRWVGDHLENIRSRDPLSPDGLNDRAADSWRPLLAIADEIGGVWPDIALRAALELSGSGREAERELSESGRLLRDIRNIFDDTKAVEIEPSDLLIRLVGIPESPWSDWQFGRAISPNFLSNKLASFGIKSQRDNKRRFYPRAAFEDVWQRYVPCEPPPGRVTGVTGVTKEPAVNPPVKLRMVTPVTPVTPPGAPIGIPPTIGGFRTQKHAEINCEVVFVNRSSMFLRFT